MRIKKKKKNYFVLSFKLKQVIPFEKVKKVGIFCHKYFSSEQCEFCRFWPKDWNSWSHNFETFHEERSGVFQKNLENRKFVAAAVHRELFMWTNIFDYFLDMNLKFLRQFAPIKMRAEVLLYCQILNFQLS